MIPLIQTLVFVWGNFSKYTDVYLEIIGLNWILRYVNSINSLFYWAQICVIVCQALDICMLISLLEKFFWSLTPYLANECASLWMLEVQSLPKEKFKSMLNISGNHAKTCK